MTIKELILNSGNKEVIAAYNEFDVAPWDYNIFSPVNLDEDEAAIQLYLQIGTERCEKKLNIRLKIVEIELLTGN